MTDDKGLNDQVEELRKELEADLLFYLRMYKELSQ